MSNDFVMDILNSAFQEQLDKFRADGLSDSEVINKFSEQRIENVLSETTEAAVSGAIRTKSVQRWMVLPICRVSDTHGKDVRPTALTTPECTGLNAASIERWMAIDMAHPWTSKTGCYENPHAVAGRWTRKAGRPAITALNPGESGGTVPMKQE